MTGIFVKQIFYYPLKSGRPTGVPTARMRLDGIAEDRRFMVVDDLGVCLTARKASELLTIGVVREGGRILFAAPGQKPLLLDEDEIEAAALRDVEIWRARISVRDAGEAAAQWMSNILKQSCRLVVQSDQFPRPFSGVANGSVNLADRAPLLLMNEASLEALNRYSRVAAEMHRFRPNIVISGAGAFAEDGWNRIRIGELEFEVTGDCARCVMTTIDPDTGERQQGGEPMTTLHRLRSADGEVNMGVHLAPLAAGRVDIGDKVEIPGYRTPRQYLLPPIDGKPLPPPTPLIMRDRMFECVGVVDEAPGVKTFEMKPADGGPLYYLAGQYASLRLPLETGPETRSFTISSSPARSGMIQFTVKQHRPGGGTAWMHQHLRPGTRIAISAPFGRFHLNEIEPEEKLALFSAGSGVTPFISMVRDLSDHGERRDVVFHHSVRLNEDRLFFDELSALRNRAGGKLKVSWNVSDEPPAVPEIVAGMLDAILIRKVCPDIDERIVFCCGPEGFMAMMRAALSEHVQGGRYYEESFSGAADSLQSLPPQPYEVIFSRSGFTIDGETPHTLLELSRQVDVPLPSDCESGICGTCRCRVIAGEWTLAPHCADPERTALSDAEKREGYILACTTLPRGALTLDM